MDNKIDLNKRKMAILEELKNSVSTTLEKEENNNKEVIIRKL